MCGNMYCEKGQDNDPDRRSRATLYRCVYVDPRQQREPLQKRKYTRLSRARIAEMLCIIQEPTIEGPLSRLLIETEGASALFLCLLMFLAPSSLPL